MKANTNGRAVAPEEQLPGLGLDQPRLALGAFGGNRVQQHHDQQRPHPQGQRGIQRRHGRAEVLHREHGDALHPHRCGHRLGKSLGVRADNLLQLLHVSAGQRFVDALRQRRHLVGRPMQLIGHGADGALARPPRSDATEDAAPFKPSPNAGKLRSTRRKGLSRLRHRARQALKARLQVILVIVLQLVGVRLRLVELRLDIGAGRGLRVVAGRPSCPPPRSSCRAVSQARIWTCSAATPRHPPRGGTARRPAASMDSSASTSCW